eukprot:g25423.t1
MRPFALHWRCHGLAPGVEATQESLEAGMAYERMLQAGLDSPHFDELRMEYYLALSAARCAELKRADVVFATCISARRGGLSAALQAEGAPELLQVVLDEAGMAPVCLQACLFSSAQWPASASAYSPCPVSVCVAGPVSLVFPRLNRLPLQNHVRAML